MAKITPGTAVNDLQWLATRFKGILDLIPQLEGIASLSAYEDELKANITKLEASQAEAKTALENAQEEVRLAQNAVSTVITRAEDKAKSIEAAAVEAAEAHRLAAREAASKEVEELSNQKVKRAKELRELQDKLNTLSSDIESQQFAYDKLVAALAELKAKL